MHPQIDVLSTEQQASRLGAESVVAQARAAVADRGRFALALSGGDTPRSMYRLLSEEPFVSQIPWPRVHLFWGDERCVAPDHDRSNYRMACEAFIGRVPIPPQNIHRMRGEDPPEHAASAYQAELRAFFGPGTPRIDLLHLGLGSDGHTASLFPGSPILDGVDHLVYATEQPGAGERRLTLSVPVLNAARRVEFLVLEPEKAGVLQAVLEGPSRPHLLPAQLVRPGGQLVWILTAGAACKLGGSAQAAREPPLEQR